MPGLRHHTNHTDHTVIRSYESSYVRLDGPAPASEKCEDVASFLALSLNAKKRRRRTAGLFLLSFFDTPTGWALILVRPTRWGLTLVRPTRARHWLAQPEFDTGLLVFARFWGCTLLHPDCNP